MHIPKVGCHAEGKEWEALMTYKQLIIACFIKLKQKKKSALILSTALTKTKITKSRNL